MSCFLKKNMKSGIVFRRAANAYSGLKMNPRAAVCYNSIGEVYLRQNAFKNAPGRF
ncbi:MAG: hypothetical protein IPP46_18135 [Bacteroidetes bacterium]|nr:hypothetical protein [Bacteroidota bacterium]